MPVEGWIVPESRALRPVLPLPLGYLCLLTLASMVLALVIHLVVAGIGLFGCGWYLGKAVNRIDPLAWGIMAKNLRLPGRLLP